MDERTIHNNLGNGYDKINNYLQKSDQVQKIRQDGFIRNVSSPEKVRYQNLQEAAALA